MWNDKNGSKIWLLHPAYSNILHKLKTASNLNESIIRTEIERDMQISHKTMCTAGWQAVTNLCIREEFFLHEMQLTYPNSPTEFKEQTKQKKWILQTEGTVPSRKYMSRCTVYQN